MNLGILSSISKERVPELTTEALDYASAVESSMDAIAEARKKSNELALTVENEIMLHHELASIDRGIADDKLSLEHLHDKLAAMATHSRVLVGDCGELTVELEELSGNAELTIEEFKKKRRGVIETLVRHVTQFIDAALNSDTYTSIPKEVTTFIGRDKPRVKTLISLKEEIKAGKIKFTKNPVVSKRINKSLGVYTLYRDKFTGSDFIKFLSEYYDLVNKDLMTTAVEEVHDSLVVSTDNETHLKEYTSSIKFIKDFKNINHGRVLYADTKMYIPTNILTHMLFLVQLAQNPSDGLIDYSDILTADTPKYRNLEVVMSKDDMLKLIDLVVKSHTHYKTGKDFEILEGVIVETLKAIRSEFMTAVYGGLFGIFALRRYVRQVYLANTFIGKLQTSMINNYQDHSKALVLTLDMIADLQEK